MNSNDNEVERNADLIDRMIEVLKKESLIKNQVDLCEKLNISTTIITRSKNSQTARLTEQERIKDKIYDLFGLTEEGLDYVDIKSKTNKINKTNNLVFNEKKLEPYVGVYKGYFVRSSANEICEMIICVFPDGRVKYKSARLDTFQERFGKIRTEYLDKQILWVEFFNEKYNYNIVYTIKAQFHSYLNTNPQGKILSGVYSGFSEQTDQQPMSGLISWKKQDDTTIYNMLDVYASLRPRSYLMDSEADMDQILDEEPGILNFFFGRTVVNIHAETVKFYQKSKFVSNFEYEAKGLAGNYLLYRLNTKRNQLVVRPMKILRDGRMKMKLTRAGATDRDEYWGRAHSFGNTLAISIDRVSINGNMNNNLHRTHYLFDSNGCKDRNSFNILFGVSTIINSGNEIRIGEEILVKTDLEYEKCHSKILGDINSLDQSEKEIFKFLRKGVLGKVVKRPDSKLVRNSIYAEAFYNSAKYYSLEIDRNHYIEGENKYIYCEKKCIENLKLAFLHGYDDNEVMTDIQKGKVFYRFRMKIEEEINYRTGAINDINAIGDILYDK